MSKTVTNLEATKFNPSALLSLYKLDASSLGGPTLYFHDGSSNNYKNITFDGIEYIAFPVFLEGFEYDGKGSLPRPKLRAANINGFVSYYILNGQNLIGAKFSRKRVFARFIDGINFDNGINPYGLADPEAAYPDDIFFINRKITENKDYVEFELATPLEIDNVKLPTRMIFANICGFKYRDSSCGYTGIPVADKNNKVMGVGGYGFTLNNRGQYSESNTYNIGDYIYLISQIRETVGESIFYVAKNNGIKGIENGPIQSPDKWIADFCSKNLAGCRKRYPAPQVLRFGGFPGASRGEYLV
jgi:lambda family phage minor tail protein L